MPDCSIRDADDLSDDENEMLCNEFEEVNIYYRQSITDGTITPDVRSSTEDENRDEVNTNRNRRDGVVAFWNQLQNASLIDARNLHNSISESGNIFQNVLYRSIYRHITDLINSDSHHPIPIEIHYSDLSGVPRNTTRNRSGWNGRFRVNGAIIYDINEFTNLPPSTD
ncbi:hypothetical protein A3Q56_05400 [Intoshia linei]|uniref:Uncharacterized protein n=1 Tax=Intoshia linei TaxID=1819745 RepID=A0A177AYE9_9BILA|nr:hypothetical protein A3Q56_05400 [Intoshia linei]